MSRVSGSQRAQSCGRPGLLPRHRLIGLGPRPILLVAYGWDRTCGCPAGPKFSSSAIRPCAMPGVAGRPPALRRLRSRVAPTQPEQSGLLSPAVPRRRRFATAIRQPATIGRQAAVADFGGIRVRGAAAWWLWGAAHIAFLIGARNRITVLASWLWAYFTFRRGSRLITGSGLLTRAVSLATPGGDSKQRSASPAVDSKNFASTT